jgi:hypothetical protein
LNETISETVLPARRPLRMVALTASSPFMPTG